MRYLIYRILIIGLPCWILMAAYFIYDPFRVLYDYEDIYENTSVIPNRDFVSSELYLKNFQKQKYDAFIFGSSLSLSFYPEKWQAYLPSGSFPFMFDASGESIYGIHCKIKKIDALGGKLKHVLLIIDPNTTFKKTSDHTESVIGVKHPVFSESPRLDFQAFALQSYALPKFWSSYYMEKFFGIKTPYSDEYIDTRHFENNRITNKLTIEERELEITQTPQQYYTKRANIFYKRNAVVEPTFLPGFSPKGVELAKDIKKTFAKHNTAFKIVIAPIYSQQRLSDKAMAELSTIFGAEHIYDFSGPNKITNDIHNYYETSHFRPHVADSILARIYN